MSDLIQQVKDGKVVNNTSSSSSSTSKTKGTNALGKDAFLQLLTTQMKYQDPLNPNTDTDYIAQLATFSQLEQLQNLSSATNNSQAYSLVGKTVVVKTEDSKFVTGRVDYVYTSGSTTKFSINGNMYDSSKIDTVYDEDYMAEQNAPKVPATKLTYDASNPKDQTFTVDLGRADTVADDVAIAVGDTLLDSSLVDVKGNKVTIKASAFSNLANGSYKMVVVFNDSKLTTVKDKLTLQVNNSTKTTSGTGTSSETGTTSGTGTSTSGTTADASGGTSSTDTAAENDGTLSAQNSETDNTDTTA